MLKQDAVPAPSSVPAVSVAQARVTPDELATALAAIEARRQAEAAHLAGTIPIDQAVSELHLDSTPDEIWAEVQKQRTKAAGPQEKHQAQAAPAQVVERQEGRSQKLRRVFGRLLASAGILALLMSTGVIPRPWDHAPIAAPNLRPLSTITDGEEVYADGAALIQISDGKPLAAISVSQNATGNRWTVFKRGGHVYLHGYIESAPSLEALNGKPLNVYNDDNSGELHGERTSSITLRVDEVPLQKSAGDSDYSGVTLPNYRIGPQDALVPGR